MGQQRFRKEYSETTDRRTFNIIHIKCVTGCCLMCSRRRKNKWYFKSDRLNEQRIPSWKLVSKNRKQWMEKPLEFEKKKKRNSRLINQYLTYKW